jgi:hypothetical protein
VIRPPGPAMSRAVPWPPLAWSAMSQGDDPRIILRDPIGVADQTVEHPDQPGEYVDERGNWQQTDESANWQQVGGTDLRVYDLIEPTTG